jgi:3,4-dihydroxy 2-butanone 4-phosphate synthase/GTP cyclohydrolase II
MSHRSSAASLSPVPDPTGLASIEEIIDDARNGRMFILVDDEDRENEGDLIIPAQMATPDAINFMSMHGRGLICLSLTRARCEALELPPMTARNRPPLGTAFTVSIEARDGVTTGISTADRARTVAVAIDGAKERHDLVSPGHVFPLQARDGGVLVRAGHTEAGVDISRLAGLNPSAVICEIMRDDGEMARLPDLVAFARLHDLKIGTIRDLIAYRRTHDRIVRRKAELAFMSRWGGEWNAMTFFNKATGEDNVALVKGCIDPTRATLVRMHTMSVFDDVFGEVTDRSHLLSRSMEIIGQAGSGVIVVINRQVERLMTRTIDVKNSVRAGHAVPAEEFRDYGVGAQILVELGVHDMVLLTNTHHALVALAGHGLNVVGERRID